MTVTATRPLHDHIATRTEWHRVIRVVGGGAAAATQLPIGLIMVMPPPRLVGDLKLGEHKRAPPYSVHGKGNRPGRRHVLENRLQGDGEFGRVFARNAQGDTVGSLIIYNADAARVFFSAEYGAREKQKKREG